MATAQTDKIKKQPISVRERWRVKTIYRNHRFSGYAPIAFAMVAEVGRLTTGKATQLLYVILTAALGQIVGPKDPFNEQISGIETSELAELSGCDERTVQRELGDLAQRKVILWKQPSKGRNDITPLFRSWVSLPDYKPGPVVEPEPAEEEELEKGEEQAKEKTVTHITTKPIVVHAGKRSKPLPVECGVASIQFSADVDAAWSAVVKGGTLLVSLQQNWKSRDGVNGLLQQKGLSEKPRQGCRGGDTENGTETQDTDRRKKSENNIGGQSKPLGSGLGRRSGQPPVSHPRADELSTLFDPFLLKSIRKTLSADQQALLSACEAIGEVPHDHLVKAVVERAQRPINRVPHVPMICREIEHNWRKQKDLPPEKRMPTREEIEAIMAEERRVLAEKRRAVAEEARQMRARRTA